MTAARESRCEKTELIASQCAHCKGGTLGVDIPATDAVIVAKWAAHYPGVCGNCGNRFDAGTLIAKTDDGEYLCERCVP